MYHSKCERTPLCDCQHKERLSRHFLLSFPFLFPFNSLSSFAKLQMGEGKKGTGTGDYPSSILEWQRAVRPKVPSSAIQLTGDNVLIEVAGGWTQRNWARSSTDAFRLLICGTVVAVGPGRPFPVAGHPGARTPLQVAVGDQVLIRANDGYPLRLDGDRVLFVYREEDIVIRLVRGALVEQPELPKHLNCLCPAMALLRHLRFLYKKLHIRRLRYALPFCVLVLYTVLGAYIFRSLELEEDIQRRARYRANTEYAFLRTISRMMEVRCQDELAAADQNLQKRHVKEHLFWLIDYLNLTQVIQERSEGSPWTWMGAMFYAGQLYTTIGYGLPITSTPSGRIASIVYIMIGIPLFLAILTEVGKVLSRGLRKLYKRVKTARRKLPDPGRRMSESMRALYHLTAAMAGAAMGPPAAPLVNGTAGPLKEEEERRKREEEEKRRLEAALSQKKKAQSGGTNFPIPWALLILIAWIMFSAALFCVWETEWGYMTSVYFFFISISTVGLGDLVPTNLDMMIVNFFMILIGLALLSMCVDLIQGAVQKFIERLIEEYIEEFEKVATVVTNNEPLEEFTDELHPLEDVETAEVVTIPVEAALGRSSSVRRLSAIGRVKDWFAERASNILLNKVFPEESASEDEASEDEGRETSPEEEEPLEAVVVEREPLLAFGAANATLSVHRSSLVPSISARGGEEPLPRISIHEGTPSEKGERENSVAGIVGAPEKGVMVPPPVTGAVGGGHVSFASAPPSKAGSLEKKKRDRESAKKKSPKVPKYYAGALLKYNAVTTMQALQAIEMAKIGNNRAADFKARLFAKFATNPRFTEIVENNTPPPKKMATASIQTSPVSSPCMARRRSWKLRRMGCAVESIDSTSTSEVNATTTRTGNSCSANDLDSLYSNTYFDLSFGYSTDDVPKLMAQANTPQTQPRSVERPSLAVRRKFSDKLMGLFERIMPKGGGDPAERRGLLLEGSGSVEQSTPASVRAAGRQTRPISRCYSTPSTPPTGAGHPQVRLLAEADSNVPSNASIPTTPLIQITDPAATELRPLTLTPSSSPVSVRRFSAQQSPKKCSPKGASSPMSPPLGQVPLHHRSLSNRRRFSNSTSLPPVRRFGSLSVLSERRERRHEEMMSEKPPLASRKVANGSVESAQPQDSEIA